MSEIELSEIGLTSGRHKRDLTKRDEKIGGDIGKQLPGPRPGRKGPRFRAVQ